MKPLHPARKKLPEIVDEKAQRILRAQQEKRKPVFFGFGMFGIFGWSVAIPTVIGVMVGRWLDAQGFGQGKISWTLTGLFAGIFFGSLIALHWVNKEGRKR